MLVPKAFGPVVLVSNLRSQKPAFVQHGRPSFAARNSLRLAKLRLPQCNCNIQSVLKSPLSLPISTQHANAPGATGVRSRGPNPKTWRRISGAVVGKFVTSKWTLCFVPHGKGQEFCLMVKHASATREKQKIWLFGCRLLKASAKKDRACASHLHDMRAAMPRPSCSRMRKCLHH